MLEVLPKITRIQMLYGPGKPLTLSMNFMINISYRFKMCNIW